jgi:hypothetical protein
MKEEWNRRVFITLYKFPVTENKLNKTKNEIFKKIASLDLPLVVSIGSQPIEGLVGNPFLWSDKTNKKLIN